jgi:2-polyprenyl-3-methyl-5-hydroxy-6-metoxy-1,4-benzoquinol methylase
MQLHRLWLEKLLFGGRARRSGMKRSRDQEMMDLPCESARLLEEDLANLRVINACLRAHHGVVWGLARAVQAQNLRSFSLLDVGTGSGDIPVRIVEWARRNGLGARVTAVDAEAITVDAAARQTRAFPEISIMRADATAPPFKAASVDFVLASQFLHHFSEENIITLLRTWSNIARRAIIISDLVRHRLAYLGIRALTQLFTRNIMTLTDAPLSVRRAFTMPEWRELVGNAAVGPFQTFSFFPFRMIAVISPVRRL